MSNEQDGAEGAAPTLKRAPVFGSQRRLAALGVSIGAGSSVLVGAAAAQAGRPRQPPSRQRRPARRIGG